MTERTNPITPAGFAALRAEYERLFAVERPAVVEIVSWAAGNGDRSENGDSGNCLDMRKIERITYFFDFKTIKYTK